jgi:hypothetical protein
MLNQRWLSCNWHGMVKEINSGLLNKTYLRTNNLSFIALVSE